MTQSKTQGKLLMKFEFSEAWLRSEHLIINIQAAGRGEPLTSVSPSHPLFDPHTHTHTPPQTDSHTSEDTEQR